MLSLLIPPTFFVPDKKYCRFPQNMECSPYLPVEMPWVNWWVARQLAFPKFWSNSSVRPFAK